MKALEAGIEIAAEPAAAFDLVHDYGRRLEWDPFLSAACLLDGAQAAGIGLSQFKSLFKQSVGLAPHQYLLRRRVERARELLERERLPIAEAAAATGFAHQSHLARNMRRLIGVTPRQLVG